MIRGKVGSLRRLALLSSVFPPPGLPEPHDFTTVYSMSSKPVMPFEVSVYRPGQQAQVIELISSMLLAKA